MMRLGKDRGFTLVELIVTMAVMGVTLTVSSLAIARGGLGRSDEDERSSPYRLAQRSAVETGAPVVAWPDSAHVHHPVLYLPDGRPVGPEPNPAQVESP